MGEITHHTEVTEQLKMRKMMKNTYVPLFSIKENTLEYIRIYKET